MQVVDIYLRHATRDFDRKYTYLPPQSESLYPLEVGALVDLPFGHGDSLREAYVVSIREIAEAPEFPLKTIHAVLSRSLLREDQLRLAEEMKRRYFCTLGQALQAMAPASVVGAGDKKQRILRLADPEEAQAILEEGSLRSLAHVRILEFLLDAGEASAQEINSATHSSPAQIYALRKKGLLEQSLRPLERQSSVEMPVLEKAQALQLNPQQIQAVQAILNTRGDARHVAEALLFGVTGSGKTEVYLRAAEAVLAQGRDVLILVPEIALTPLIVNRIRAHFGDEAAILHSRLTAAERYAQWLSIRRGEKHVVAGARSAIFAPLQKIGLIVIDEEQENSYKSERTPRYHAAEIARLRALMHGAVLVLSSATPSVVSFARTEEGRARLVTLSRRAGTASLPKTTIVNMRDELAAGNKSILSRALVDELRQSFAHGEQAMIVLNRRGYNAFRLCRDCGYIPHCENCDVALTEHTNPYRQEHQLICHYCGRIYPVPEVCPNCGSPNISRFGIGTEQAMEVLQKTFPEQHFLRMDLDTTAARHGHERILEAFFRQEADCLVGTQMIAKGHDFARVTTVGILSADLLLGRADYAAEEQAFQLICQAAGRAGRKDLPGNVIVQAYNASHPVILAAAAQDYRRFFREAMNKRRTLLYPPFAHLAVILLAGFREKDVAETAEELYQYSERLLGSGRYGDSFVYEPAPAPIPRLRRHFRYRLVFKGTSLAALTGLLQQISRQKLPDTVRLNCDIDPLRML